MALSNTGAIKMTDLDEKLKTIVELYRAEIEERWKRDDTTPMTVSPVVGIEYRSGNLHFPFYLWVGYIHYERFVVHAWSGLSVDDTLAHAFDDAQHKKSVEE